MPDILISENVRGEAVDALAKRFEVVSRPGLWKDPAALLACIPDNPNQILGGLNTLGQPLWTPAGPNGFADSNAAWAAPAWIA